MILIFASLKESVICQLFKILSYFFWITATFYHLILVECVLSLSFIVEIVMAASICVGIMRLFQQNVLDNIEGIL